MRRHNSSTRIKIGLFVVFCLAAITILMRAYLRSLIRPLLLEHVTQVIPDPEWRASEVHWLSDHEFIFARDSDESKVRDGNVLRCYNTQSKQEHPVSDWPYKATVEEYPDIHISDTWNISGDNRCLLLQSRGDAIVTFQDGRRILSAGGYYHANSWWLGNSHYWLHAWWGTNGNLLEWPSLYLHTAENDKTRHVANTENNPLISEQTKAVSFFRHSILTLNVENSDDAADSGTGVPPTRCLLLVRDVRRPIETSKTQALPLPIAGYVTNASFSPNCDQVALFILVRHKPGWYRWLARYWHALPSKESDLELWTVDSTGKHPHLVGVIDASDVDNLSDLSWLPGGKRLSFVYKDALYTVPTD